MIKYSISLSIAGLLFLEIGTTLSLEVTGRFTCNGKPANVAAHLAVLEEVGNGGSGGNGRLQISSGSKLTTKAKLFVYYKCAKTGMCYERLEIDIPSEYLTESKAFDVGTVNVNQPPQSFVRTVCGPWSWGE